MKAEFLPLMDAEEEPLDVTKVTVLSFITIMTLIGNCLVILAILARNVKITRMYYFIIHLSVADLLTAVLTLTPEIVWTFTYPKFYGGNVTCKAIKFCQMLGPYLSSYVLIMTAIDRYQAICFPLSNCTWTPKRSKIMIGSAWFVATLLCVPQTVVFIGTSDSCSTEFVPGWGQPAYVIWFSISNFFIPLVILLFCYGRICYALWDNFNSKSSSSNKTCVQSLMKKLIPKRKKKDDIALEEGIRSSEKPDVQEPLQGEDPDSRSNAEDIKPDRNFGKISRKMIDFDEDDDDGQTSENSSGENTLTKGNHKSPSKNVNLRTHSIQGISRAKIKTVKLTIVVILGYIVCSAPFICVQMWATFGSPSESVCKFSTVLLVKNVRGQFAAFLAFKATDQRHIVILLFETRQFLLFMKFLWDQPVLRYSTHGSQKSGANQKNREKIIF